MYLIKCIDPILDSFISLEREYFRKRKRLFFSVFRGEFYSHFHFKNKKKAHVRAESNFISKEEEIIPIPLFLGREGFSDLSNWCTTAGANPAWFNTSPSSDIWDIHIHTYIEIHMHIYYHHSSSIIGNRNNSRKETRSKTERISLKKFNISIESQEENNIPVLLQERIS